MNSTVSKINPGSLKPEVVQLLIGVQGHKEKNLILALDVDGGLRIVSSVETMEASIEAWRKSGSRSPVSVSRHALI